MSVLILVVLGTLALAVGAWAFLRRQQSGVGPRTAKISDATLIEKVKLAINPAFPRWVLFSNNTYAIVEDERANSDPRVYALEKMRNFGRVHVGSPAGDFSVTTLHETEGWSASGHGQGIYTYLHPSELKSRRPMKIGLHGRSKRDADAKELRIVYVSGSG